MPNVQVPRTPKERGVTRWLRKTRMTSLVGVPPCGKRKLGKEASPPLHEK